MLLLGLRGTPILYYGDELGMEQVEIPPSEQLDTAHSRDGARTPMPWAPTAHQEWWIRHGDLTRNVEDMRADETSTLWFTRELLNARRSFGSTMTTLETPAGVWAWRRGESAVVAVNLGERNAAVRGVQGRIRLSTRGARSGDSVDGTLQLGPWEGAVVLPQ